MRFILLDSIDKAYEDLGWVDYYTINKITDGAVFLTIYTKIKVSKEDSEFDTLIIRNSELEAIIGKEIVWDYKSVSNFPLKVLIRNIVKSRKERYVTKYLN